MSKNSRIYASLTQKIGYEFVDQSLLISALTHRSASVGHNERLEFLGDSILNFIVAEALFEQFPDAREGEMSRLRASLVKGDTLAEVAQEMGLSEYLILGEGEMKSGGFRRASILADCVEAIIGAIFRDAGIDAAREAVLRWYAKRLKTVSLTNNEKDPKTQLQEWLQARRMQLPVYALVKTAGESHSQNFTVECRTEASSSVATATGLNRRQAEKLAAEKMLKNLRDVS